MDHFRNFVEDRLAATSDNSLEHMAFHFTMRAIERGEDMTAYLADNQQHTIPQLQEAYAALLTRWQQLNADGRRV